MDQNAPAPVPLSHEELKALEREALLAAVARGDTDVAAGRTVPHERVREWLLDWAAGGKAPVPQSTAPD
jgi:predicted transcriptional regulator